MEKIIGKIIEIIKKDLEREVLLVGLECLQTLLKEIGSEIGSVEHIKNAIIDVVKDVLNGKVLLKKLNIIKKIIIIYFYVMFYLLL